MKVLVVGGTGAIGLASVRALAVAGHQVRASARGAANASLVRAAGAEAVDPDIYDVASLRQAIRGSDGVIRLTTKIPSLLHARRKAEWDETNRLRTVGAEAAVSAALAEGVGFYLHESFYSVYSDAGDRVVDEAAPTNDGGIGTMRATLTGESQARRFTEAGGNGVVLRFGAFYGTEARSTHEAIDLARRRMLPLVGNGRFFFPSIYVEDAARAVVQALGAPAGIYNICDDEPLHWVEYLQALTLAIGAPAPFRLPGFLGPVLIGYPWSWLTRSVRLSNARFQSITPWRPAMRSVREGWPQVAESMSRDAPGSVSRTS